MQHGEKIAIVTWGNAAQVGRRVAVELIQDSVLRQALSLWSDKCGGRLFPARDDITPRDMSAFLRNVTLYRVLDKGGDFEYRVMGDAAVVAWERSFTGMGRMELNVLQPGMGDLVARVCRWVFREREPLCMRGLLRKDIADVRHQETIFLPLSESDETVDHILSVGVYAPQSPDEFVMIGKGTGDTELS